MSDHNKCKNRPDANEEILCLPLCFQVCVDKGISAVISASSSAPHQWGGAVKATSRVSIMACVEGSGFMDSATWTGREEAAWSTHVGEPGPDPQETGGRPSPYTPPG